MAENRPSRRRTKPDWSYIFAVQDVRYKILDHMTKEDALEKVIEARSLSIEDEVRLREAILQDGAVLAKPQPKKDTP